MPSLGTVKQNLPPYEKKTVVLVSDQGTGDIIKGIMRTHGEHKVDYDLIYQYFDCGGDTNKTCKKIWDFLKHSLRYEAESGDEQSVRSPSAILSRDGVDCKHYSLFISGILDAIKRNKGDDFEWFYRFASYNHEPIPGHVFVVVRDGANEFWVDPVLDYYNQRKYPSYNLDKKPRINGCGCHHGSATSANPKMNYFAVGAMIIYLGNILMSIGE
jgi:hypothetical protein